MTRTQEEAAVLVQNIERALRTPGSDYWRAMEQLRRARTFLMEKVVGSTVLTEEKKSG